MSQYRGATAVAAGAFHYMNNNVLLNAGAAFSEGGERSVRAGVTFGF